MSDVVFKERRKTSNRLLDVFVVLFCLTGAAASLYFFYQDIYSSFRSSKHIQAGTVTVKHNTVQRRVSDRMVWDRLFAQSPVYSGDLVRIARLSGATLNIDENSIELGENTLIRIQKDAGSLQIDFSYGNINVSSGKESGVVLLSVGNQIVQVSPGGEINAISGDDGLVLSVTEGVAQIIRDGQVRDVPAGGIIVQDTDGNEVLHPMAAVFHPKPNDTFLKTEPRPLNIEFTWTKINMQKQDLVRLEIAEDKNFTRIVQVIDNLDSSAAASVNAGIWHWRILHENNTLASGRMSVIEATPPVLLAPASGGSAGIPVKYAGQEVQFRWAEVPNAAYYLLQISKSQDFYNPEIALQVQVTSYVVSDIDIGTWYWRVQPVFSNVHEGEARFSQTSAFQVEPVFAAVPVLGANNSNENILSEGVEVLSSIAGEDKSYEELFLALREEVKQMEQKTIQPQLIQADSVSQIQQQVQQETSQQQPLRLTLIFPAQNAVIPGLTALRQPTIFRWDTNEDIVFSRFVLSRRANPASGRPEIDIQNPGRTVSIPVLAEGTWYWTVEGRSRDGSPITAAAPRQIRVQPVPLLPEPQDRLPGMGFIIGAEELRQEKNIVFSWSRVAGANSYILSILKDGFPGKQQIFQTEPISELTYTLEDFSLFETSGKFYWQVEAVFYNNDGRLEQHGTPGENTFMLDVPRPGRVQTKSMGTLYGR
jgi:hypothetical protein